MKRHHPASRIIALLLSLPVVLAAQQQPAFEFTRMIAHWDSYGDPEYLSFVDAAEPQVAQVGFYGAHFWSLVHTPQFGGYPAHFPVQGIAECSDWLEGLNAALHRRGVKVVGHFNVTFLVGDIGDPASGREARGFFKWYRDAWDEGELGPKPTEDPVALLEKGGDGSPIVSQDYAIGGMKEYSACLRNPHWRSVLKAWVRHGITRGVDGYMINYFYRRNCHCEHCDVAFRSYLRQRFTPAQLQQRFGIEDLAGHRFEEIVSWHDPRSTSPLRLEMLRFSQVSNKEAFDEVFVAFGRSLMPGLILGQWNHLGDFTQISGDERCLLPSELWAKDEDYLWYSTGGAANYTDLANRFPGDATLQARYLRGASGGKTFTLGKYEATRIRAAIAELAANGGAPMGFYTRFTDAAARTEIVRYYQFLKIHDHLYHNSQSHSESVLVFPRSQVHRGDIGAVDRFRSTGRALLDRHVLFDVIPDDMLNSGAHSKKHHISADDAADAAIDALPDSLSRFDAPFTVRVSASRPTGTEDEIDLHFVNYLRKEPPPDGQGRPSTGGGIVDERPVPCAPIAVDFVLPGDAPVNRVEFVTPEGEGAEVLEWSCTDGRLRFSTPGFLVYGVARIIFR